MELIKIEQGNISGAIVQTVNARDLYLFLESKRQFADWMRERIDLYEFEQDVDYIVVSQIYQTTDKGGYPRGSKRNEYYVSLDMAKEIAMVERNDKGRKIRQYFIECERRLREAPADPIRLLNDPAAMRGLLLTYSEKVLALEAESAVMKPQVEAFNRIAVADGSLTITEAAKALQVNPRELFKRMRQSGWLYRRPGNDHDLAYQDRIVAGCMEHKTTTFERSDGTEKITTQARVTPKGLTLLARQMGA